VKNPIYFLIPFFLAFSALVPLACNSGNGNSPTSPSHSGLPTNTNTVTATPTSTATITPTPNCQDATPIATTSINGPAIQGNDATDLPPMNLDGYGPNGDVYTFTLSSPATLNFSLCPTDDDERDMVMILRAGHCWSPDTVFGPDNACDSLPEITGFPATQVGNPYYLIVAENGGDGADPYTLLVTSGSVPGVICTVTPTSTPQAVAEGEQQSCQAAYNLGSLGPGDSVATGYLTDDADTDDWYTFTANDSGPVTVTMDCFDNGLGQVDFDIYGFNSCPTTSGSSVGSSSSENNPEEQFVFTAMAGATYFIDANAYFGGGPYRLTIQVP
jgi:hypothetical protein